MRKELTSAGVLLRRCDPSEAVAIPEDSILDLAIPDRRRPDPVGEAEGLQWATADVD
jgi:hypothetical protein